MSYTVYPRNLLKVLTLKRSQQLLQYKLLADRYGTFSPEMPNNDNFKEN